MNRKDAGDAKERKEGRRGLRRYWLAAGGIILLLLLLFGVAEAAGLGGWPGAVGLVRQGGPLAACVGVALLIADVLLPVPSSVVMVLHGAAFGFVPGMALSLAGGVGASLVGFALGRRGGPLLERLVGAEERARADRLLARWGALAVVVSRPVPLLAETVSLLAGASPLSWRAMLLSSLLGTLPSALLYAWAGAVSSRAEVGVWAFAGAMALSALLWLAGRALRGGRPEEAKRRKEQGG